MARFLILIMLLLTSCSVTRTGYSQSFHTTSNKAVKAYNEGLAAYDYIEYDKAEALFLEALEEDHNFYEAYVMLGELYTKQTRYVQAAENYKAAVNLDSLSYKPIFFALGDAEMKAGDYTNALVHYRTYLNFKGGSEKNKGIASRNIINCEFAIEALKNPVAFNPENIGSAINTSEDEYWPSITADGQTLMFTRQLHYRSPGPFARNTSQEDFYISFLSDSGWTTSVNAGAPLNTSSNEGAQTLSSNGNYMYFTACERAGGLGSCDIYFSAFNNGQWTHPYNLGSPVNSSAWESTPSISADGNLLIFSSNRQGGFGGKDLWYSVLRENGKWSVPVNLGDKINTPGEEMSPFIHFDGRTLYFTSDGRPGMGGFDIYLSKMNEDSTWTEPRNLGYPINTSSDDMGLVIETSGQKAYFSSKRNNSAGKDIFFFNLDESLRPTPVSYLKGKVTDKETGKLLKADYELINLSTNKVTAKNTTDDSGNFLVCLPSGNNYGINISKPGYLFYSENFMFEGQHTAMEPLIKRIALSQAKVGEKITLTNVFYEIDSWELRKESMTELNNLANLLADNKRLIVEIGGFTDSTGTDEHNMILSEKRALSVVNYLINKGISSERLKYRGYGNSLPIGDNVTSEGRRLNRRTEARVIGTE
jgi:outer membrane protein OmpA-like peptidoglycan-associated protein/tetratricopeptide (TPR) repeat protein